MKADFWQKLSMLPKISHNQERATCSSRAGTSARVVTRLFLLNLQQKYKEASKLYIRKEKIL